MTVLVVDDEAVALNALVRRVKWEKYGVGQVFTSRSMQQAQQFFLKEHIDFMLCDIEMPSGSGLDLLEWVKIYYPKTECIFITAHPEFEYARQALRLGSADYVLKPVDYAELDTILEALVNRLKKQAVKEHVPEHILQQLDGFADDKENRVIQAVKQYILEHISETIYIEDLAGRVHLNAQYLMRSFKKEEGVSILEFMTRKRIELAEHLLRGTDYPVNRIADMAGYGNYSYFSKIFKRETGKTPAQFRKEN